jgi:hypothetical protein
MTPSKQTFITSIRHHHPRTSGAKVIAPASDHLAILSAAAEASVLLPALRTVRVRILDTTWR